MTAPARNVVVSEDGTRISYLSVGAGEPLVVIGGALASAADYLSLADHLADRFEVHVLERRGRRATGPQGPDYGIDKELQDLDALLSQTGARRVFGHSYGGLIALEAAMRSARLERVALYEPGIAGGGMRSDSWLEPYSRLLATGDRRGAFALFVQQAGRAPAILRHMPLAYVKLVLRLAIPAEQWQRIEPLLETNLREHQEIFRLAAGDDRYNGLHPAVLVFCGSKAPQAVRQSLRALAEGARTGLYAELPRLAHDAPEADGAPQIIAEQVTRFMTEA